MIIKDANHINQCILEILIKNARTPLIKIAKSVGLSRAAVKNHIDKMEKCGVIEGYTVILGSNGVERSRSVLFDIQVSPACFNQVADALAAQDITGTDNNDTLTGGNFGGVRFRRGQDKDFK